MPSSQKLQIWLKPNCTWMFIGWSSTKFRFFVPIWINIKNTKFVKDLPMIDAQYSFNQCNSFREEHMKHSLDHFYINHDKCSGIIFSTLSDPYLVIRNKIWQPTQSLCSDWLNFQKHVVKKLKRNSNKLILMQKKIR
jgi:hypothetical protein